MCGHAAYLQAEGSMPVIGDIVGLVHGNRHKHTLGRGVNDDLRDLPGEDVVRPLAEPLERHPGPVAAQPVGHHVRRPGLECPPVTGCVVALSHMFGRQGLFVYAVDASVEAGPVSPLPHDHLHPARIRIFMVAPRLFSQGLGDVPRRRRRARSQL